MAPVLTFNVDGDAVPQGSKVRSGPGIRDANAKALHPWRQHVAACALDAIDADPALHGVDLPLVMGPVALHVTFVVRRPKSHYGTGRNARQVKATAPWYVATRPDLDKQVRAIGDALLGIVYQDDGQVASLRAAKVYGPRAMTTVEVVALPAANDG